MDTGDESRVSAVASSPEVQSAFTGMDWSVCIVDLSLVQSFQKIVVVDDMNERIEGINDSLDTLLPLCIPDGATAPPAGAFTDLDGKGFTVSALNPNLRVAGGQLAEAQVSPAPGMPAVRMQAITFLINMGASYLQVVRYQGRSFVRDGYHRAAALIRHGITAAPCIFIEAKSFEQVGCPPGSLPYEILLGDRPPMLSDFWDELVSKEVTQLAVRKVVRVRAEEFVVPR